MKPLTPLAVFAVVSIGIPLAVFIPAAMFGSFRFALILSGAFLVVLAVPSAGLLALAAWLEQRART